ncbi:MAG: ThiF family adenylyltransferase [Candidatus Nanohaloarchaea archaeon]
MSCSKTILKKQGSILKKLEGESAAMYSRFTSLEKFGEEELRKLQESKVAVIGLGATGSAVAENLARHGAELILVDRDYLEQKDVYSSSLYTPGQCSSSLPKAKAAEQKLSEVTPVEAHVESLNPGNLDLLEGADLIVDGTDNMETRFLLNEYSKKNNVPWIYTAALAEQGYSMLFDEKCFNCVFETVVPGELETCESAGIMREAAIMAASRSAETAVRYLSGKDPDEELWRIDGEVFEVETPGCEVCRGENFPAMEKNGRTGAVCGENKYQVEVETTEAAFSSLQRNAEVEAENEYLTRADYDGHDIVLFRSGRAIVQAKDSGHAESLLSETLGL